MPRSNLSLKPFTIVALECVAVPSFAGENEILMAAPLDPAAKVGFGVIVLPLILTNL